MVTDVDGDTGFVVPLGAAKRLSNIRFRLLPDLFSLWTDLRSERDGLRGRIANLEQQVTEAESVARRNDQARKLLEQRLDETEKVLKRKSFTVKFYRLTTIVLGVATATMLITR